MTSLTWFCELIITLPAKIESMKYILSLTWKTKTVNTQMKTVCDGGLHEIF